LNHDAIIIDKSTVPVGTADQVRKVIAIELKKRKKDVWFDVISNPEFLKEGAAINDFMKPDRIIIGAEHEKSVKIMQELYAPFVRSHEGEIIVMDIRSAEMTKYAANAMLATRISFMNEMALLCEVTGANINDVRKGIGSDPRIGHPFLYPGCGYGGSCFPKDIQALIKTGEENGIYLKVIKAAEEVNKRQKTIIVEKIIKRFGSDLRGKTFALWGLAFKPETDDMRYAPSIVIIEELTRRGAKIQAYDPAAMDEAKKYNFSHKSQITFVENKEAALHNADALIVVT